MGRIGLDIYKGIGKATRRSSTRSSKRRRRRRGTRGGARRRRSGRPRAASGRDGAADPARRALSQHRRRRALGAAVVAQHAAELLQPDSRRPEGPQPPLRARIEPRILRVGRRRQDVQGHSGAPGQSLIHGEDHALWVDPADPQSPHRRRRRRRVDLVGPRPLVGLPQQHARRRSSTRSTWTTRCRSRCAAACRTTASGACRAPCAIATASRTATRWNIGGGDGFYVKFDRERRELRVRRVAERQHLARQSATLERTPARPAADVAAAEAAAEAGAPALRSTGTRRSRCRASIRTSSTSARSMLFRSPDDGATWTAISPDLTTGIDPATLPIMGAPRAADRAVAQRRLVAVRIAHVDRRVAARRAGDLHRRAGRHGAGDARRRQDVDEPHVEDFRACRSTPTSAPCCRPATRRAVCTRRSTATTATTTSRTST